MLRFFFSIFFFSGVKGEGGVRETAGIAESMLGKWHHKIGSLLFCLRSVGMPGGVIPPPHLPTTPPPPPPPLNGGNELCNLLQTCTQ